MRLTISEPEEIKLNMTAMIDIVFQLLVFFIMTFKVVAMEGDFKVKMPLVTDAQQESIDQPLSELIYVNLRAGANGNISSIEADGESLTGQDMFRQLTKIVEEKLAAEGNPEMAAETELEFEIDYGLKYAYTVKAIESVSGRVLPDGSVKKLIQKIKFKDTRQGG